LDPCFLTKQLIAKDIHVQRASIYKTSCDLRIETISFLILSANRPIASSAKFVCASQQAAHRSPWGAEPSTGQQRQEPPCIMVKDFRHMVILQDVNSLFQIVLFCSSGGSADNRIVKNMKVVFILRPLLSSVYVDASAIIMVYIFNLQISWWIGD
jgi:hypothetical protein